MKHKTKPLAPADQAVINRIFFLFDRRFSLQKDRLNGISVSKILQLASEAWNCTENDFKGKINHRDKFDRIRRRSFLAACLLYSNEELTETANQLGMTNTIARNCTIGMGYYLNYRPKGYEAVYKLFLTLNRLLPYRLTKLFKVDFTMIQGISDFTTVSRLSSYQIGKIPVKELSWFYNNNTSYSAIAYNLHDIKQRKLVIFRRTSDHILLHTLQEQGWRFIFVDEWGYYHQLNQVCDRCVLKNNCSYKGNPGNYECFEELPDNPRKIDIELLYPLQNFQLQ